MMTRSKTILWLSALVLLSGLSACMPKAERSPLLRSKEADLADMSFARAKQLLDQGNIAEAITAFRALLREDGPSLPVLNGLAIAHAEIGRPDLAAERFAKALAIAPDDPVTLNNIGFAALRRKETELARHYLEKAEQAGGDEVKISGNLKVLDRLETWVSAGPAGMPRSLDRPADALFTVQRQTASTLSLSGLQIASRSSSPRLIPTILDVDLLHPAPPQGHPQDPTISGGPLGGRDGADPRRVGLRPTLPSGNTLVDFNDVFDPWPEPSPHSKPSS